MSFFDKKKTIHATAKKRSGGKAAAGMAAAAVAAGGAIIASEAGAATLADVASYVINDDGTLTVTYIDGSTATFAAGSFDISGGQVSVGGGSGALIAGGAAGLALVAALALTGGGSASADKDKDAADTPVAGDPTPRDPIAEDDDDADDGDDDADDGDDDADDGDDDADDGDDDMEAPTPVNLTLDSVDFATPDDDLLVVADLIDVPGAIDGGDGMDTLSFSSNTGRAIDLTDTGADPRTEVSNIEEISIDPTIAGTDDVTITVAGRGDDIDTFDINNHVAGGVTINGLDDGDTVEVELNGTAAAFSVSTNSTADREASIVFNGAEGGSFTGSTLDGSNNLRTASIDVTGGDVVMGNTTLSSSMQDLSVTGDADLDMGTVSGGDNLASLDSTGLDGDLTADIQDAAGAAVVNTGAGDDTVTFGAAGTYFLADLGEGDNTVPAIAAVDRGSEFTFGSGDDTIESIAGNAEIEVTLGAGDDTIEGITNTESDAPITIDAGAGDDEITSSNDNDETTIDGGEGNDTITAAAGTVTGGAGVDTLTADGAGAAADVVMTGDAGDDDITITDDGLDAGGSVDGGADNDSFTIEGNLRAATTGPGAADAASVTGGDGDDSFTISGQLLAGDDGSSSVDGGAGDDTFTISGTVNGNANGDATVNGGEGDDTFTISATGGDGAINGDAGEDAFTISDTLADGAEVNGGNDADTFEISVAMAGDANGGEGNDTFTIEGDMTGDANGGEGNDTFTIEGAMTGTVDGGDGNDTIDIDGALGATAAINGGDGDDEITVRVAQTNDVTINGGAGGDTIDVAQAHTAAVTVDLGATDGAGDNLSIAMPGAGGSLVINDFEAGSDGDVLDLVFGTDAAVSGTSGSGSALNVVTHAASTDLGASTVVSGLTVIDGVNAPTLDAAGLAGVINGGSTPAAVGAADQQSYILIDNGTHSALFFWDDASGDQNGQVVAGELTLVATFNGIGDATELTADNFADFA